CPDFFCSERVPDYLAAPQRVCAERRRFHQRFLRASSPANLSGFLRFLVHPPRSVSCIPRHSHPPRLVRLSHRFFLCERLPARLYSRPARAQPHLVALGGGAVLSDLAVDFRAFSA